MDNFYGAIDSSVKKTFEINNNIKPSCKKGCSACCKQLFEATSDEVDHIISYCERNNITIDVDKLKKDVGDGNINHDNWFYGNKSCVFLKNNKCSIYPARPNRCRIYYVRSDKKYCYPFYNNNKVEIIGLHTPALLIAMFESNKKTEFFPKLLLEKIEAKNEMV